MTEYVARVDDSDNVIEIVTREDAGKWSYSAAGHVEEGEDYQTAALRELKEELGIDGKIEDYIGLSRTVDPVTKQRKSFHRAYKVIHNGPFDFDKEEADEIRFFSKEELSSMIKNHPEMFKANLVEILSIVFNNRNF